MHLLRKINPILAFLLALPTFASAQTEKITPLMLSVQDAPIPFVKAPTAAPTSSTNSN